MSNLITNKLKKYKKFDQDKKEISEKDSKNPITSYGISKLMTEKYIQYLVKNRLTKVHYIILRYFNVAGADLFLRSGLIDKKSTHLIKVACEVATNKRKFLIVNGKNFKTKDRTAIRDFIHVSDLAEIHILSAIYLFKKKKSQIINCGYGKGYSVLQIVETFNKIIKRKIKYKFGPRRKGDAEKVISNCKKLKKILKWKPKYNDIKLILKSAYKWEKKI